MNLFLFSLVAFGSPEPPPPPPPAQTPPPPSPALPPPARATSPEVGEAARRARRRLSGRGVGGTLLTPGQGAGASIAASPARKRLLGE